jgi:hypothetical protein
MTDMAHRPSDGQHLAPEKPGEHHNHAQTEAQTLLHKNEKPAANATAEKTVQHNFGTVTITDHGKPAAPVANKAEAKPAAKPEANKPAQSESWTQWAGDHLWGAAVFGEEMLHGAVQSVAGIAKTVGHVAVEAKDAVVEAAHHAPETFHHAVEATEHAGSELIHHPGTTLLKAGEAIEHGVVDGAKATLHGAEKAGKLIVDHPVESLVIAAAVAAEVVTLGGATPLLVGLGAVGTAFAAHDVVHAVENVHRDAAKIAPLFDKSHATPEQLEQARKVVAGDTGSATADVLALGTGIGVAKLVKYAEVVHAARATRLAEEGVEGMSNLEPVVHAVAKAGVKGAEICQATLDHSSTVSNVATVGGHGAPPVRVADVRDRHRQFNQLAPAP